MPTAGGDDGWTARQAIAWELGTTAAASTAAAVPPNGLPAAAVLMLAY